MLDDPVWQGIKGQAGASFSTASGREFSYQIRGGLVYVDRGRDPIGPRHVRAAIARRPWRSLKDLEDLPSPNYLRAILEDPRIRRTYVRAPVG